MPPNITGPVSYPQGLPLPGHPISIDGTLYSYEDGMKVLSGLPVNMVGQTFVGAPTLGQAISSGQLPNMGYSAAQLKSLYYQAGGTSGDYGSGGFGGRETPDQRLDRIANEILSGKRDFESVRASVDRLAGRQHQAPGVGAGGDAQAIQGGIAAIRARVAAIFQNRGVPLDRYDPGDPPPGAGVPGGGGGGSGGTGGGSGGNPGGQALDADQRDALSVIRGVLSEYGLESLADWAWDQVRNGYSPSEILLSLRERDEFKRRFPAIAARQQQGLAPISPGEYVGYERSLQQMETAAGLLRGTLSTPEKVQRYLEGDVSVTELQARVNTYIDAAVRSPAEDVAFLRDTYGLSGGELASFFLDPDVAQPLIEQRWNAAQVGGAGLRTGYDVTGAEAESIARLGVSGESAQQGFGTLVSSRELFSSLPGEGAQDIGRQDQLAAVFGGNEHARQRIAKRQRERQATFEQGGGFSTTREGFAGLGAAR